jgi:hypothetical protein
MARQAVGSKDIFAWLDLFDPLGGAIGHEYTSVHGKALQ